MKRSNRFDNLYFSDSDEECISNEEEETMTIKFNKLDINTITKIENKIIIKSRNLGCKIYE